MFGIDITPLVKEIQEFKNTQTKKQDQIIDLLKETNELLKKLLQNDR